MNELNTKRTAILATVGFFLTWTQLLPGQEKPAQLLKRAYDWRYRNERKTEALTLCDEVAQHPDATREQKMKAYDTAAYIYSRNREYEKAIAAMERMRNALPGDKEAERTAWFKEMELSWNWGKPEIGLQKARAFIESQPEDKPSCARAYTWMSRFFQRMRRNEEAYEAARKAAQQAPEDAKAVANALWEMNGAAWNQGKMEDCLDALERLLEPTFLEARSIRDRFYTRRRYGEALMRVKRYQDAHGFFVDMEKQETDPRNRQEWCLWIGRAFAAQEKFDEALAAFERVFTEHAGLSDHWYSAQAGIVDVLRKQDRTLEAIRAARINLDAARDRNAIISNTRVIADCLKQLDGHVGRANQMIAFQRFGPAGEDGKPGTEDDPRSPLRAVGYPRYPEREKAFAKARDEAGDTAMGSRHCAMTYIYTGHPQEALRQFLDAFGRATGGDFRRIGYDLLALGVRSVRGHPVGLQPFVDFVNYGPAGADGKSGTADDLIDPFKDLPERSEP